MLVVIGMVVQTGRGKESTRDRDVMETRDIYKGVERKGRKRRRRVKGYLRDWREAEI